MGSKGKKHISLGIKYVSSPITTNTDYADVGNLNTKESLQWFQDNSNIVDWSGNLLGKEVVAIDKYTGSYYTGMNNEQYTIPWESGDGNYRNEIVDLHNAISKYELNTGVVVTRGCDFQIFGADKHDGMSLQEIRDYLSPTGGVVQNDGFMSFTTYRGGHSIAGHGLIIRLRVPPSVGAGAYVDHISSHQGEQEFILNNNAVLKFDLSSLRREGGTTYIDADWIGNTSAQTISPTNTSKLRK